MITTRCRLVSVALSVCLLSLAACGGRSKADDSVKVSQSTPAAAGTPGAGTSSDSSAPADSSRAGSVDVCSLLTLADASSVAHARGLGGDDAASATYKLSAEKQDESSNSYPASSCKFTIAQVTPDNTGSEVTIVMLVQSAKYFDRSGTKVEGLGDEAYEAGGATEVRVGGLMLEATENSGGDDFAVALYRVMIPKLR